MYTPYRSPADFHECLITVVITLFRATTPPPPPPPPPKKKSVLTPANPKEFVKTNFICKWDKVFKNEPSKIFQRLSSTNFTWSILEYLNPNVISSTMLFHEVFILKQVNQCPQKEKENLLFVYASYTLQTLLFTKVLLLNLKRETDRLISVPSKHLRRKVNNINTRIRSEINSKFIR